MNQLFPGAKRPNVDGAKRTGDSLNASVLNAESIGLSEDFPRTFPSIDRHALCESKFEIETRLKQSCALVALIQCVDFGQQ